ncbi:MAG TPA: hypothetical protein VEV16_02075 [Daejeonella sp.]|nr:hypothetical protein [Daejeonella sp.]
MLKFKHLFINLKISIMPNTQKGHGGQGSGQGKSDNPKRETMDEKKERERSGKTSGKK